jgi:hypothetical protein
MMFKFSTKVRGTYLDMKTNLFYIYITVNIMVHFLNCQIQPVGHGLFLGMCTVENGGERNFKRFCVVGTL